MSRLVVHQAGPLRRSGVALALAVMAVAVGWWAWQARHAAASGPLADAASGLSTWLHAGERSSAAPAVALPTFRTGLEDLPASLRGTEVDGELQEDAQGHLVIARGVRAVFDYFLSTRGEQPDAVIHERIRAYIRYHLKSIAAGEALALLDHYLAYQLDVDGALSTLRANDLDALRNRVATIERLRNQHFDPTVVQAFFGDENTYDHYTLDKMTVLADGSLSPQQKAARLRELRQALPASLREHLDVAEQVQSLNDVTEQWRARHGSPAELRAIRESMVGAPAADRLEALDREEGAWDARIQSYLQARQAVLADPTLVDATKQQRIAALRSSSFSGPEQLRAQTFERMADEPPRGSPGGR